MSKASENLQAALPLAMAKRPKVGGFPYLEETLRRAGVTRNFRQTAGDSGCILHIDYGRHRMNLPDAPIAHEGFFATHFFTVRDQEKSKDFYVRILGGKVINPENPC